MENMLLTIVSFILILSLLVLIHEAGHFFVAKKLGIKVEEFGFGFPPRIIGKKFGETEYTINALLVGGFVKLYGEDDAGGGRITVNSHESMVDRRESHPDVNRAFFARPAWQRFVVVVAGVVMNFLLALVILTYLYAVPGVPQPGNNVEITNVSPSSPASSAHLQPGDLILGVSTVSVSSTAQLITLVKQHAGYPISMHIQSKQGKEYYTSLIPRVHPPKNQGALGVEIALNTVIKRYPWYEAPFVGIRETLNGTWQIIDGLGQVIALLVTSGQLPAGVAGPVGIARITGDVVRSGFDATLALIATLSLNLAVLNILPIPALDGGRFFFILIEIVTRRKVNQKFESYAHSIGMIFLLTLIALVTLHDIWGIVHQSPVLP